MQRVNVMEKALNILRRELSGEEFLTYLESITPKVGEATKELSEKTEGLNLQEVIEKAKGMKIGTR